MTKISSLSQRLTSPTLHFVLLSMLTCGVWPLLWLYKKQDIISDATGYPLCGNLFIIWLAVCFGVTRRLASMVSSDVYDYDPTSDTLLALSGVLSLACGVMYIVWAFRDRTALRHYALNTFRFDLKMNTASTIFFNIFYINYCINVMPEALAKHQIIHGKRPTSEAEQPDV